MAPRYEKVILCRGIREITDSQEPYVKVLSGAGYVTSMLCTLCFKFVNLTVLRDELLSPNSYHGLIVTSQRVVEAIGLASEQDDNILQPWKNLPVYCVGPATESLAKNHLGLQNCFGSKTGNSKELAKLLVGLIARESKPLLYPCSDISQQTIEKSLTENEIQFQKIIAYKTLASETLEHDLLDFMDDVPKIFVFFSPSTVEHIVALLKKKIYDMNNVKAVAIGPVTGQALVDAGLEVFAIANKPDPVSLVEAIIEAEERKTTENTD